MARKRDVDVWIWDMASQLRHHNVEVVRTHVSVTTRCVWTPKVDIIETESYVLLVVELPGVELSEVELVYRRLENVLAIKGRRGSLMISAEERPRVHQLEIIGGDFEREIVLPRVALDLHEIRTSLENGLLSITIPKA
jgi:HSP20 family protein